MGPGPDTPLLEAVKIDSGASPVLPPLLLRPQNQPDKAPESRKRRRPVQPTQSDAVLINFIGNHNYPDIAQEAFENPLAQASDGENDPFPSDDMQALAPNAALLRNAAEHAVRSQESMESRARSHSKNSAPLDLIMNSETNHIPRPRLDTSDQTLTLANSSVGAHMLHLPDLSAGSTQPPSAIKTPDTSQSLGGGGGGQSLPPLRNHLGTLADRKLPPLPTPSFSPSSALQSPSADLAALRFTSSKPLSATSPSSAFPNSATSPPATSHPISPPRNFADSAPSPQLHRPSLQGVTSPQTESTPSSLYSVATYQHRSPNDSISSPEHVMQMEPPNHMRPMLPLPTAPGMTPGVVFRCKVTHCTAPPFQTQYLLNSHMNVHSSARPHYCPKKGCPRSEGGKGFKRKNEMIRHGLVHQSPGYACPFCPDREHKYPRPDNLQRHVKVHHLDKDKDDPVLREVLNQRIDGGSRGRRKRANS